jgi:Flp pilus assembly protein TadG
MRNMLTLGRTRKTTNPTPRVRRGQGLVEFALVMPILLLLIMGIVDFGWMVFNYNSLYNGVREALRYGSVTGLGSTPQYVQCQVIRSRIRELANTSGIQDANIDIWFDDGRATTPEAVKPNSMVAECVGTQGTPTVYSASTQYDSVDNDAAVADNVEDPRLSSRSSSSAQGWIQAGDRINVRIDNAPVRFLTPFLRTLAPNGLSINIHAARTLILGLKV